MMVYNSQCFIGRLTAEALDSYLGTEDSSYFHQVLRAIDISHGQVLTWINLEPDKAKELIETHNANASLMFNRFLNETHTRDTLYDIRQNLDRQLNKNHVSQFQT